MTQRAPWPESIDLGGFTVAEARDLGLPRGRLRRGDLVQPTRGVRRAPVEALTIERHASDLALALPPDTAFSHLTAARLLGLPAPSPWPGALEPLDVMRASTLNRIERSGCRHHRGLESRETVIVSGLPAVAPLDTWADLCGVWSVEDLVVAADALLARGVATRTTLMATAESRSGRRRAGRGREAAALARVGSGSPAESRARLNFHDWGLPEPALNRDVFGAEGDWLARSDFVWEGRRVVGEYDGDIHRTDRNRWLYERQRRAAIEDAGWAYVEMTALSFANHRARTELRARLIRLLLGP